MKKLIGWSVAGLALMVGLPGLTVAFAGEAGMAVCFVLFFAANPWFALLCGAVAGSDIRRLWPLTVVTPLLFLAGVALFFTAGEPAFLLYAGVYLALGVGAMLLRAFTGKKKKKK